MAVLVERESQKEFQKYGFKAGFLKLAILKLVSGGPIHGYALIKDIQRLTDEDWKPSPGSIYPALHELQKEELVTLHIEGRRKLYEITPKGMETLESAIEHATIALRHLNRLLSL